MGAFQPCDTCTDMPMTTAPRDDRVQDDALPLTDAPSAMDETLAETLDVAVPAMGPPPSDDAAPVSDSAPLVLPAVDGNVAPQPVPPPVADIMEPQGSAVPLPVSPSATAIAAVASAIANEAASQVKKALESSATDAAELMSGVSESTAHLKKPFSLTWVMYDVDDPLGQVLALVTLSPVFIMVMYATLILFQRDLHIIFMVLGQLVNEVINQILKRTIDQKRPDGADMEDAGMPSAHSQFMAFFATYVVLYTSNRMSKRREWEHKAAIVGVIALACLVFVSRIRLGYHTVAQVVVGAAVGAGTGILWYIFMENMAIPHFPAIASSSFCQQFFIRDASHIGDMVQFSYDAVQKKRPPPKSHTKFGM
ncbi:Aste57867_13643 [Aphanomyces stellatus]|uniref:Dolichyldiphosphatase n=1 Tax=Aphanomyces stellatus TaxID=120398 RepID=A0A485KZJ7_9STRA|nr:hypothetical protein As57867_013593 [Aphanomyces stellatus]VFT90480.1 Aste57867_13643 [Aphanomyces stellatus]